MRNKGFGILEVIWVVAIISTVVAFYQMFYTRQQVITKAKNMAQLTQFYAKTYGRYLDDMQESTLYSMTNATNCARINPFDTNNSDYYILGSQDLTNQNFAKVLDRNKQTEQLSCQKLNGNYWSDAVLGMNDYKQVPCVALKRLSNNKLQAFLYWANNSGSVKVPTSVARASVLYMDGAGAYIESGVSKGSPNWSISASDEVFNSRYSSCTGVIGTNSIVFDMSGYIPSNNKIGRSFKLGREKDFDHDPNSTQNKNTAQSNVYMAGNKIILDEQNTIQAKDDQVVFSGRVVNTAPMAIEAVDSYTPCDASEVGTVKRQKDLDLRQYGAMQVGNEICTAMPVVCGIHQAGSGNCYIPTKTNTVRYSDLGHTGKLGTTAKCPDLLPVLRSATVWQLDAGSHPTQTLITTQAGGFNIVRGLTAVADNKASCKKWQFTVTGNPGMCMTDAAFKDSVRNCSTGDNYSGKYCSKKGQNNGQTFNLICDGKSTNGGARNWQCVQQGDSSAFIETMICSSKYYVEQQ